MYQYLLRRLLLLIPTLLGMSMIVFLMVRRLQTQMRAQAAVVEEVALR